jgi:hypothetical protein
VADGVDALVYPMQTSFVEAALDPGPSVAEVHHLRPGHNPMLPSGKRG